MRKAAFVVAAGLLISTAVGCSRLHTRVTHHNTAHPTIAFDVYDMTSFITLGKDGVDREAQALGAKILWRSASNDVATQANQIETLISQRVDAIVIAPVDAATLEPQIKDARHAGIPVFITNLLLREPAFGLTKGYVGPDDVLAGEQETEAMAGFLHGHGNVVLLQGPLGSSGEEDRTKGVHNVLKRNPGMHLLSQQTANWDRAQAYNLMSNWMQAFGKKIDGVIAENDDMAIGANQALATKGLSGKMPLVGIDGIQDGMKMVQNGKIWESNLQNAPLELGEGLAVAVRAIRGQPYPKEALLKMPKLTKQNVDDLYDQLYVHRDQYFRDLPELIKRNIDEGQYGRQTLSLP